MKKVNLAGVDLLTSKFSFEQELTVKNPSL